MKRVVVIMAGGKGERFWPRSREGRPKQFLAYTPGGPSLLQQTVARVRPLVAAEDIFVVGEAAHLPLLRGQLPGLPEQNLLAEPAGRNTLPCVAFAAGIVAARYGDAVMAVLPSDHLIEDEETFCADLGRAMAAAGRPGALLTIGLPPQGPETGYGYIHCAEGPDEEGVFPVRSFKEKPDLATAKGYLEKGGYLWNSGIFAWRASTLLAHIEALYPEMHRGVGQIAAAFGKPEYPEMLREVYPRLPALSIDYGLMEKVDGIFVLRGAFGWDDAGSWSVMERLGTPDAKGNITEGEVLALDCAGSILLGNERLIACIGLEDLVVVDTPDALLVCKKQDAQRVREVADALKKRGRKDLL